MTNSNVEKRLLLITGLLWFSVSTYFLLAPPKLLGNIPYQSFDKLSHIMLFMVGTYITIRGLGLPKALLLMCTIAAGSELLQGFSPNRTTSLNDMLANLIGIAILPTAAVFRKLSNKFVFDKLNA